MNTIWKIISILIFGISATSFADKPKEIDAALALRELLYSTLSNHALDIKHKIDEGSRVKNMESATADAIYLLLISGDPSDDEALKFADFISTCVVLFPTADHKQIVLNLESKLHTGIPVGKLYVLESYTNMIRKIKSSGPGLPSSPKLQKTIDLLFGPLLQNMLRPPHE